MTQAGSRARRRDARPPDREAKELFCRAPAHAGLRDSWNKITFKAVGAALQKHPVRIAGQMFFDASHAPCGHPDHKTSGDPKRRSNWEIHPVYTIDVCKNKMLAGCQVDDDSKWKSFDKWVQNPK